MKTMLEPGFYFSRSERRGVVVLTILSICLFAGTHFFPIFGGKDYSKMAYLVVTDTEVTTEEEDLVTDYFDPNEDDYETLVAVGFPAKAAQSLINYRAKGGKVKDVESLRKVYHLTAQDYERLAPFALFGGNKPSTRPSSINSYKGDPVDINTSDSISLYQVGFRNPVLKSLLNYRRKGGKFKEVEDVKKIWGMTEEMYAIVSPHLKVEKTGEDSERSMNYAFTKKGTAAESGIQLDINTASAAEWEFLRGIGEGTSKRIIDYRTKLGGFHHINQVKEVWGMSDSLFQYIQPHLVLETPPTKFKINELSIEDLAKHPYVDWKMAKLIVRYREQHGPYRSAADLMQIKIMQASWLEKLLVYIDFEG
jgi:competence ComEA-like helix-hairpin-helix protein